MAMMEKGFRRVGGACGIASGILFIVAFVLAFIEPQFPGLDPQASLEAVGRDPIGFLVGVSPFLALPFLIIISAVGFYRAMRDGGGGFALAGSGLAIAGSTILAIGVVIRVFSGLALAYLYSAVIPSQQPLVVGLAEVVGVFLYWGFLALPYAFLGIAQIAFSGSMLGDPVPKWYGLSGIALGLVVVYLALSINVYLESTVFGVFRLAYGRIGPTEVRIILVLLNTAALVYEATTAARSVALTRAANWGMTAVLVGMIGVLVARFAHNLHRLAKLEPQRFRWWE